MKIEIKSNDIGYAVNSGDLLLFINDELVMEGRKSEIIKKVMPLIDGWF